MTNYIENSFEKYLEKVCFEANPTVLDDDMPDFFDDWLGNQNGEDYIRLADEYATETDRRAREERDEQWRTHLNAVLGTELYKLHEKHFLTPTIRK